MGQPTCRWVQQGEAHQPDEGCLGAVSLSLSKQHTHSEQQTDNAAKSAFFTMVDTYCANLGLRIKKGGVVVYCEDRQVQTGTKITLPFLFL